MGSSYSSIDFGFMPLQMTVLPSCTRVSFKSDVYGNFDRKASEGLPGYT